MSDSAVGPRRSARNAAKRVADKVEEVVKAPAAKKTKTASQKKSPSTKLNTDETTTESATVPESKTQDVLTKRTSPESVAPAPLEEGDELPSDLPPITKHTGESTSIQELMKDSKNGIVIFAYPKASTPGCTTQACLFRDSTAAFKEAGYAIYGVSGDSPRSNTNFHTKQNLGNIVLLCDPQYELHERLGIKKIPKGTIRSVTVIKHQDGKAIIAKKSPANPAGSLEIAKKAAGIA